MNIDCYTCLAPNSAPYADALCENMESLKSGNHNVRYWAMVASSDINPFTLPKHWGIVPVDTSKIEPTQPNLAKLPSVKHSKLLNQIAKLSVGYGSDITVIVDCDMFIFQKNWDEWIFDQLETTNFIGTPKHDNVLHMYFLAARTEYFKRAQLNFSPGDGDYQSKWKQIKGEASAKRFQIVKGASIVTDTGWHISEDICLAGFSFTKLLYVKKFSHLYYDDLMDLFCAHMGGSHKKEFKSAEVQEWYKNCKHLIHD